MFKYQQISLQYFVWVMEIQIELDWVGEEYNHDFHECNNHWFYDFDPENCLEYK